ncbi:MAG: response regulator transcription factor [Bacteroidota bacterium]|nr:response regulator transcription factor [Bacteroidota bacterium]
MRKTILIVDDEKDIVDLLKYNLQKEGYKVETAFDGEKALELVERQPDLILLDIMLPEYSGLEVVKEVKKNEKTTNIPVIFLTAKGSETDEIVGLELGADDYIVKPISIPKLLARIKLVLRRSEEIKTKTHIEKFIKVGRIEIFPDQYRVFVNKKEVFFPKKEFEVLLYLAMHKGKVVNRESLLNAIWGDTYVIERTIDVHIRKIREKLGSLTDYIETIKGVGYRLREDV